jgi:uroporphyrin-III C-methyltransferase
LAVPASAGIPLTARGVSESFWVVTGTTMRGEVSNDIRLAAQSTATIIILMGLNKISEIMEVFISHHKSETPVAVIQNGTLKTQRIVTATVGTICEVVSNEGIQSPAIIVVGEVVKYAQEIDKIVLKQIGRG